VQINSTGGIFLRLDSSGNLNIYDTSGTSILKFLSGAASIKGNLGTLVSSTPIATTTSTTIVNVGYSSNFTPQISTRAFVGFAWTGNNSTAGDGVEMQLLRNTGTTNPTGGTAASGTLVALVNGTSTTNSAGLNLGLFTIDTGLTIGQAYTYSLAIRTNLAGAGTANISNSTLANALVVAEI
jgi:hypothetical protein